MRRRSRRKLGGFNGELFSVGRDSFDATGIGVSKNFVILLMYIEPLAVSSTGAEGSRSRTNRSHSGWARRLVCDCVFLTPSASLLVTGKTIFEPF